MNELEYINGKIYANQWYSNNIFIINPSTGIIEKIINLTALVEYESQISKNYKIDVLNGIAYYPNEQNVLLVTGKLWSNMYKIKLK